MTRLWEVNHPYYCSESNYYVGGVPSWAQPRSAPPTVEGRQRSIDEHVPGDHMQFDSWAEFDWKDADKDYNLLFRWDWEVPDPDDYAEGEEMPGERLSLFWMLQRKGRFMVTSFPVKREEEPEIRAWLATRAEHLAAVWEPLLTLAETPKQGSGNGA